MAKLGLSCTQTSWLQHTAVYLTYSVLPVSFCRERDCPEGVLSFVERVCPFVERCVSLYAFVERCVFLSSPSVERVSPGLSFCREGVSFCREGVSFYRGTVQVWRRLPCSTKCRLSDNIHLKPVLV